MDRNSYVGVMVAAIAVALRKESVDRNVDSRLHSC